MILKIIRKNLIEYYEGNPIEEKNTDRVWQFHLGGFGKPISVTVNRDIEMAFLMNKDGKTIESFYPFNAESPTESVTNNMAT